MQKVLALVRKPSLSFQVLSDLHLEVGNQYESFQIPGSAPYLILAGDIGRLADEGYAEFLHQHASRFDAIFLVLGNHEFYGMSYDEGLDRAKDIVGQGRMKGKIVLLDRTGDVYEIPHFDVALIGCTLWSYVPDLKKDIVGPSINDFKRISGWTVDTHNQAHHSEVEWLQDQVKAMREKRKSIILVTHYAPCREKTSRPEHVNSPWNCAFATDVMRSMAWPGVKLWVYGHTHFCSDFNLNGIRVVGNQRGYVFQPQELIGKECEGFDIRKIVSI
jgi:Calcineurin-like phosphoesterase